jgi:hypothetical protein
MISVACSVVVMSALAYTISFEAWSPAKKVRTERVRWDREGR